MEERLSPTDKSALLALYEGRYEAKGRSHETVGWGSKEDQHLRFEVLLRGLDIRGKSILDVGCGLGDLVPYLDAVRGNDYDYLGVDLSEKLVSDARATLGGPRREFRVCDILEDKRLRSFDLVLLSGTLNFRVRDTLTYAKAMLRRMLELSRECASANFLSSYVDWQDKRKNFHYAPEEMFAFAKTLTRWICLHHDYPLWEFTLQLRRRSQPSRPQSARRKP